MSAESVDIDRALAPLRERRFPAWQHLVEMNYLTASQPAHGLGPMVQVLHDHGIAAERLLEKAGIPPVLLLDMRAPVGCERVTAFLEAALAQLGRSDAGLLVGQHFHWGRFGAVSLAGSACPNLVELYRLTARHPSLIFSFSRASVMRSSGTALVRSQPYLGRPLLTRYLAECDVTCGLLVLRQLLPPAFAPSRVRLPFLVTDEAPYRRFFGCPIDFGTGVSDLCFDAAWLDYRLPGADEQVRSVFESECRQLAKHISRPASFTDALRQQIRANCRLSRLDTVARSMGMTVRSVQRRLAAEGTTFSSVLRAERMELACQHLRHGELPVARLALLLGFGDTVAFSHAFKQWMGEAPSEFRGRTTWMRPSAPPALQVSAKPR